MTEVVYEGNFEIKWIETMELKSKMIKRNI
jgi:hypothetical protein